MKCHNCGAAVSQNDVQCPSCGTQLTLSGGEIVGGLLALGGLVLGGVLAAKAVKKGFSLLKDVDWESLSEEIKRALEQTQDDFTSIKDNGERLKRAEGLLAADDKISTDQAAMLVCATLEAGLKTLSQKNNVESNFGETEGMVEIATNLKDANVISYEDLRAVKNCVYSVRNPVMHGNFSKVEKRAVQEQIDFVRTFFIKHRLMSSFSY